MAIVLDSNVKIGETSAQANPIQGSVSLSLDESNISIARYEGGSIAGVKGSGEYQLSWQTFEMGTAATKETTIIMSVGDGSSAKTLKIKGIYVATVGWSSDYGFITDHKITGAPVTT